MIYNVVRAVSAKEIPWYNGYPGPTKPYPTIGSTHGSANTGTEGLQELTAEGYLQQMVDGVRASTLQNWQPWDDSELASWLGELQAYVTANPAALAGDMDLAVLVANYTAKMTALAVAYSTPLPPPPPPASVSAGSLVGLTWVPPGGLAPVPVTNVTDAAQLLAVLQQILATLATQNKRLAALENA